MSAPMEAFQPDAQFAVTAQQDTITKLRADNHAAEDRIIYLSACLMQVRDEANMEIARLHQELSIVRGQLEVTQEELETARGNGPKPVPDPQETTGDVAVDAELAGVGA